MLLLTWYGNATVQSVAAYLIAWLLLLAAPRPLVELLAAGRRRGRTTDPDQLAGLTRRAGRALDPAAARWPTWPAWSSASATLAPNVG